MPSLCPSQATWQHIFITPKYKRAFVGNAKALLSFSYTWSLVTLDNQD